ncbi:MAG: hypothetical protein JWR77_1041 [Rhizorhabdus sp.]|nr:hypothetical protein [Rhizorhabdus sp.]
MTPEFSRPFRIDTLGEGVREVEIEADEAERAALAARFALAGIAALSAKASLTRKGETILATGELSAQVTQICVATAVALRASVSESFSLRFVPTLAADEEEIELSETDCDTVDYADGAIDLGEAVAETMALALDPFPRSPDADAILKAAGIVDETEVGPFAALKALRDKL